ncbi:MAG: hypothetical protein HYU53_00925 [Acidobacteria bacterium]|nr:hypothetical protein [Acidobacteriota bacterium]
MGSDQTRRRFLTALTAVGTLAPFCEVLAGGERQVASRPVDALGLDSAQRADLEGFAQPVLEEAALLEELALDDCDPAFVFVPR